MMFERGFHFRVKDAMGFFFPSRLFPLELASLKSGLSFSIIRGMEMIRINPTTKIEKFSYYSYFSL